MIIVSRAIVLHNTAYNDSYSIAHLFSRESGRVPYLIPRSSKRGKGGGSLRLLISPLNELEITAEHKPHRDLHFIKEAKLCSSRGRIQSDPVRNSIALFLTEFLYLILRLPEADTNLYDFVASSIDKLEEMDGSMANFHLAFLFRLLVPLGLIPDLQFKGSVIPRWFDPADGRFVSNAPAHGRGIPPHQSTYLQLFSRITFDNMKAFRLSRAERRQVLDYLVDYYRFHLPPFPLLKTPDILSALFD